MKIGKNNYAGLLQVLIISKHNENSPRDNQLGIVLKSIEGSGDSRHIAAS